MSREMRSSQRSRSVWVSRRARGRVAVNNCEAIRWQVRRSILKKLDPADNMLSIELVILMSSSTSSRYIMNWTVRTRRAWRRFLAGRLGSTKKNAMCAAERSTLDDPRHRYGRPTQGNRQGSAFLPASPNGCAMLKRAGDTLLRRAYLRQRFLWGHGMFLPVSRGLSPNLWW